MSVTKHRQRASAVQWNPPKLEKNASLPIYEEQDVVSSTECTGLTQQPVMNESESVDYSKLYAIHEIKPQGNVGKCNPRNDPSEIVFHRESE